MRGQPGPCLAPGNAPAARRRRRKPPPIIMWTIGIITCLLFIGAAAMLTVGYLNPFGTVGLAILGVGAVVYFGAILFLVMSCLWVERKYPGVQPLSFKIYSRKPNRMPATTFANPNISGQIPADTTPSYRPHNEIPIQIPGFTDVGGKTDKIPSTPKDSSQEKNDNNPPSHGSSQGHDKHPQIQSTALDVSQEGARNGGIQDDGIRLQTVTNNDNAGMKEKAHSQPEQNKHNEGAAETQGPTVQPSQSENDNVTASPQKERKVKPKTHHIEVPFEDYPPSNSTYLNNKKERSQDMQKSNPKDNSQQTGDTRDDQQKETSSSANNLSHARDARLHQNTKTAAHLADKDMKQESSNLPNNHKSKAPEKEETVHDGLQQPSTYQPTAHARKQNPDKQQNNQDNSNSAPSPVARKVAEHENYAPANSLQKDSAPKASPVRDRKRLDVHKNNTTSPDQVQESVHEKSQTSSPLKTGKNILPSNINLRNEQQNVTKSPKHGARNPESPGGSPKRAQKMQSPDRARKMKKDNAVPNSPPVKRKADDSPSPSRHHHKRPEHLSKAQRTQEQSITIQTFSSTGMKEEIQKKILHSSASSQSSDLPSSSSSSSPRQRQRSPHKSPRLPRNADHTARATVLFSPKNEEISSRQVRQSSPSSSDVPSSPKSSPKRTRQKSPDLPTKMQRQKHIQAKSALPSSSNKTDELHKRHSQPSLQASDVLSSPTSSPKKLLQSIKEKSNQTNSDPQQRTNK